MTKKRLNWYTVDYLAYDGSKIMKGGNAVFAESIAKAREEFMNIWATPDMVYQITGVHCEGTMDDFHDRFGLEGQLDLFGEEE